MVIDPATTETIKEAAPTSSPMASDPDPAFMAAKVENTSGAPLPSPKKAEEDKRGDHQ